MKLIKVKRAIVLAIACMSLLGSTALAVNSEIYPNIEIKLASATTALTGVSNSFNISQSSGYAVYSATTTGTDAATSVTVSMVVQRRVNGVWETVPNTYKIASKSGRIIAIDGSRFLEKGYWYRLQSVHIAYAGSTPYSEVLNSSMQWYS